MAKGAECIGDFVTSPKYFKPGCYIIHIVTDIDSPHDWSSVYATLSFGLYLPSFLVWRCSDNLCAYPNKNQANCNELPVILPMNSGAELSVGEQSPEDF